MSDLAAFLEALEDDNRPVLRDLLLGPTGGPLADFLLDDYETADLMQTPLRPNRFDDYLLLDEGTAGGFAEVFQAWDVRMKCVVALKRPWAGADLAEQKRFYDEARTLSGLTHPNIVPIRECGEWYGVPYFTMLWCERGILRPMLGDPKKVAELMIAVASAVAHAHLRGVWHMDLKPSNVLLDENGRVFVADFGLSLRPVNGTAPGARRGTVAYMSPEQAAEEDRPATAATDVHGLGALLYYLLTGQAPNTGDTADELLARARAAERPSPQALNPSVPADLVAICRKAMALDPAQRYPTPDAFAADLTAWLEWKPTKARKLNWLQRLALLCRRNPVLVLVFLSALVVAGLTSLLAWQQVAQAHQQSVARQRADLLSEVATEPMDPPQAGWRERLLARIRDSAANLPMPDPELRDRTVSLLLGADARLLKKFPVKGNESSAAAFEPRSPRVLFNGAVQGQPSRLWNPEQDTTEDLMVLRPGPVGFRDGQPIQWCFGDGVSPELWDLAAKRRLLAPTLDAPAGPPGLLPTGQPALAMTAGGERLAAARPGALAVWNGRTGEPLLKRECRSLHALALSPDGRLLALGEGEGRVRVVPLDGGADRLVHWPEAEVQCVAFDPNGQRLAIGSVGGAAVFQLDGGRLPLHCQGGRHAVTALAWSASGTTLLVASNQTAHLFDAHSGKAVLDVPVCAVSEAAFAEDGRLALAEVRHFTSVNRGSLHQIEMGRGLTRLPVSGVAHLVRLDDAAAQLAVLTHGWQVFVYDLQTGAVRRVFSVPGRQPGDTTDNADLAFSPDGKRLVIGSGAQATEWDLATGAETASWELPAGGVVNALMAIEGGWVLFRAEGGGERREATLWELRPGQKANRASVHPTLFRRVTRAVASPRRDRFVFYACGNGDERRLIGLTPSGTQVWVEKLDQKNENLDLEIDATGRVVFVGPTESGPAFRLDPDLGERLGPLERWPLCASETAGVGLHIPQMPSGQLYREALVVRGDREQFRLGPLAAVGRNWTLSRNGNRLVYVDSRGAPVACVVPEVIEQLRKTGVLGR